MLRISSLLTSADGLEEPLGISALPMPRIDVCPNPKYSHAVGFFVADDTRNDAFLVSHFLC